MSLMMQMGHLSPQIAAPLSENTLDLAHVGRRPRSLILAMEITCEDCHPVRQRIKAI
jgi:hypothetical protein